MLFKLAWRNLWRNKVRTGITLAAVFLAVFLAIFMRSMQEGIYQNTIKNMVSFYTGYVQIHQDGFWDEQSLDNSFSDLPEIAATSLAHPGVETVAPRLESFALASTGELSEAAMVVGVDPEKEHELTFLKRKITEGNYFTAAGQGLMVAEGLCRKLKLGIGDTLILLGQGYHGVTAAGKYPISGMLHFGNPDLNKRLVYMPIALAQTFYGAEGRLTAYAIRINDPLAAETVAKDLRSSLASTGNLEIMDWKEMLPELIGFIEADRGGGVLFMFILYTIISFGMFGTVLMMVQERKFEFGVMTAIGMKRRNLSIMVFLETVMISILGVLIGSLFSLPIVAYFQANPISLGKSLADAYAQFGLEAVFPLKLDPAIFSSQMTTILVFALLVSIYPAFKIMRMQPVQAMRS
ncbi:MAG: FtsX-like permease family protein [Bacteroidota bacterium]